MADPLDSHSIARRSFEVARRGYEQQEVRAFLHEVSSLYDRLQREANELRERAERAEARLGLSDKPDEAMLLEILGEETTRVLSSAREAASEIRTKAEAAAERIIGDATGEAAEARAEAVRETDRRLAEAAAESEAIVASARTELERRSAEAEEAAASIRDAAAAEGQAMRDEGQRELDRAREEAEAAVDSAREKGRQMVAEAQAVRERVLRDLAVRRKKARQQVEKLNAGRERLLQAYDVVRRTIDEATEELGTSLSDARLAADAAARRIEEEDDPTLEQLDEEVATAALVELPIVELDDHDDHDQDDDGEGSPGPFSGEVPAVPGEPVTSDEGASPPEPPVDLEERRGRKGRRRKDTFEGIDIDSLPRVEPPAEGEGVTILAEPVREPEPTPEPSAGDAVSGEVEDSGGAEAPGEVEEDLGDAEGPGEAEAEGTATDDDPPTEPAAVDDLFARLRAEQQASDGPDDASEEAEPAADAVDAGPELPEDGPVAATAFTDRDEALVPIDKELSRRLKRALADEQNDVLDKLRRAKPQGVDDLLPEPDQHAGQWADVAAPALRDAATAGAGSVNGSAATMADLADELARSLTAPLRERIDRSFAASDGNLDDVSDRVRALYREWKGKRLTDTSRHYVAAAYARGVFDGLDPDITVRWVLDPTGGPCPDCEDNVLGGAMTKGTEFPTGHQCAPAHPGCRCLVLAADA